jgi:hypothetical protein
MTSLLAMTWLFNLLLLISLIASLLRPAPGFWPWIALITKSGAELYLLSRFARPMQRMQTLTLFPQAEILHLFYVVIFGVLGPFTRVRWKETAKRTCPTRTRVTSCT